MCECISPPPLFDLPPPPDPTLIWHELILLTPNITNNQFHQDLQFSRNFFHQPADFCTQLSLNESTNSITDNFWNRNENVFYYILISFFMILFIVCCVAISVLRLRKNNFRLKNSHRSTPSLNSSKMSSETIGTATATMVASVGSGCGVTIISNAHASNNCVTEGRCRLPQMYHSATISRRTFAPTKDSYYCTQYQHSYLSQDQQQHQQQFIPISTSCQNGCAGCCCYMEQKKRIFNSQSAIFGNICLSSSLQPHQCMNSNVQFTNYNAQQQHQQDFINGTFGRNGQRCAALRMQNQPSKLKLLPVGTYKRVGTNHLAGDSHSFQVDASTAGYCTLPYEYEEISNTMGGNKNRQAQANLSQTLNIGTTDNNTIFEHQDLNQTQLQRLPPPIGRPPPIPVKSQLITEMSKRSQLTNELISTTYQTPPLNSSKRCQLRPSSLSSIDFELHNIDQNVQAQGVSADRSCNDATSFPISTDDSNDALELEKKRLNNQQTEQRQQYQQKLIEEQLLDNNVLPSPCNNMQVGERESGYGTDKSRRIHVNGIDISPPTRLFCKQNSDETTSHLYHDFSEKGFARNLTYV